MHQNSWFRNDAFVVMLAIPVVVGGIEDIATLSLFIDRFLVGRMWNDARSKKHGRDGEWACKF